jgi:hypothetical protein
MLLLLTTAAGAVRMRGCEADWTCTDTPLVAVSGTILLRLMPQYTILLRLMPQ